MSNIAEDLVTIAENMEEVYKAGFANLMKALTNNGERYDFSKFFYNGDCTGLTFDSALFENATVANNLFYLYQGTELPKGVIMPKATNIGNGGFGTAKLITEIYDMQIPIQSTYNNCFNACNALVTIGFPIKCDIDTVFTNIFYGCKELVNVTFEGAIGKNISVSACNKLTHDSLMSLINTLYDYVAAGDTATHTATLGATNLAKLSEAEKAIATQKGWSLA